VVLVKRRAVSIVGALTKIFSGAHSLADNVGAATDGWLSARTRNINANQWCQVMSVEFMHTIAGFTFIAVWAMIGQITVREP
jgi:hypothetical protein